MSLEISKQSKTPSPVTTKTLLNIQEKILGKSFLLSLVFVGDKKSKELNQKYRQKDYIPNVLSFLLENNSGEIFINLRQCKKECKNFEMGYQKYVLFLFIHGCLHLKGLDHGEKMEKAEKKYLKLFSNS